MQRKQSEGQLLPNFPLARIASKMGSVKFGSVELTELFCEIDNFCKEYEQLQSEPIDVSEFDEATPDRTQVGALASASF